jgi:phosphorylcholine metabolism protein LicD
MAYNITLTGKNKVEALELLELSAKIIDRCKMNYWLDGGTLLGIVRENRLLPWDDDIDISMLNPGQKQLKNLIKAFEKANKRVKVRYFEKNCDYFSKNNIRLIKIRNKSFFGLLKGKVCLEIFIRYQKNDTTYCKIGEQVQIIPYNLCNSYKTILFNNYNYHIPTFTAEYLTLKYGDWKTPVKDWCVFKNDKSMS